MKLKNLSTAIAVGVTLTTSAWALPATSVNWVQQSGVTSGSEAVEIWVRLTVAPDATESLILDGTTTGLNADDWATLTALDRFASIDRTYNSRTAACGTNFFPQPPLNACYDAASPWKFEFNFGTQSNFDDVQQGPLAPGESRDYLFGTFTPQHGPVAPGTYSFSNAFLSLGVMGKDKAGADAYFSFELGAPCASNEASCAFTRVVSVPEPQSYVLMGLGLLGLASAVRRQRKSR